MQHLAYSDCLPWIKLTYYIKYQNIYDKIKKIRLNLVSSEREKSVSSSILFLILLIPPAARWVFSASTIGSRHFNYVSAQCAFIFIWYCATPLSCNSCSRRRERSRANLMALNHSLVLINLNLQRCKFFSFFINAEPIRIGPHIFVWFCFSKWRIFCEHLIQNCWFIFILNRKYNWKNFLLRTY